MRIAILEDDQVQAGILNDTLSSAGHHCHLFPSGDLLVQRLRRETFDLLILDWIVPGMSGEEVLKWVRQDVSKWLPILFLTSRGRETDIASILDSGADDYIVKPVGTAVLLARVEALLRRAYSLDPSAIKEVFGEIEFDLKAQKVLVKGKAMAVTQKEFDLALLLFRGLGKPLSRAHIIETVWKQAADIPSRTMDTHVSGVRTKLGLRPENGYRLSCIYGYGYRLDSIGRAADQPTK